MSDTSRHEQGAVTRWLQRAPSPLFAAYAMTAGFLTYFCMYAFRKPFAAASYEAQAFLGTDVDLKTAFVISQILGYTLSKFIGIKVCSEMKRRGRALMLLALIGAAEGALVLFGALPSSFKIVAIFANGLPLGMVWGVVVSYLEGRRTSELLLAGLSTSFIVSSGAVKDVGVALLDAGVSESWMPALAGALFLPLFALSVWMLDQLPQPSPDDVAERTERAPMDGAQRLAFVRAFLPGLVMLLLVYFFLTAFRDFRDNYGVEVFAELGYADEPAIFTRTELPVAFGVMLAMATLNLIKDNRRGLLGAFVVMTSGMLMLAVATLLFDAHAISGATWMVLLGLGSYLAYVPFNSVLFDRMLAATRVTGTAVFAIYLADALGYTGSIGIQLFKDLVAGEATRYDFLHVFTYVMAIVGGVLFTASAVYFWRKSAPSQVAATRPPPA